LKIWIWVWRAICIFVYEDALTVLYLYTMDRWFVPYDTSIEPYTPFSLF